ncbi:hypothetical protein NDU88_003752 [Pleurodeles waltl]|uniref:Uncharacterized protein n=1 Tax=Pleurodeles waltl TaxID=8319 RepID=A0AAV7UZC9_PLEWA|nr:hypothetical protein NDU88_003752 [Pleurodeles waltl]
MWCLTRGRVACEAVPRSSSASALEFPADVLGSPRGRVACLAVPRSGWGPRIRASSTQRGARSHAVLAAGSRYLFGGPPQRQCGTRFAGGSLRGRVACLAVPQRAVIPPTGLPKGS